MPQHCDKHVVSQNNLNSRSKLKMSFCNQNAFNLNYSSMYINVMQARKTRILIKTGWNMEQKRKKALLTNTSCRILLYYCQLMPTNRYRANLKVYFSELELLLIYKITSCEEVNHTTEWIIDNIHLCHHLCMYQFWIIKYSGFFCFTWKKK